MDCIHIVGNRPQFIKLALLHRAIAGRTGCYQKIIHTGQHYDAEMSDVFFKELNIPAPDHQLSVNQLPHHTQIGRMTEEIGNLLAEYGKNTGIIVYGDTNTTLAGALAAKKTGQRLAHAEAGIRTFDENMPEESNRYITDRIAELNFCPTSLCLKNLENEGFNQNPSKKIYNTGDIMLDAWHLARTNLKKQPLNRPIPTKPFILATIHREENNGSAEKLAEITEGLNEINKTVPVIMPCHPRTRLKIKESGIQTNFDLLAPLSYLEMMQMLDAASYVVTDSGGFCREAFFSSKPSLAIMEHPFWPEIIETGACIATAASRKNITDNFTLLQKAVITFPASVFGSGNAASLMADIIEQEWK